MMKGPGDDLTPTFIIEPHNNVAVVVQRDAVTIQTEIHNTAFSGSTNDKGLIQRQVAVQIIAAARYRKLIAETCGGLLIAINIQLTVLTGQLMLKGLAIVIYMI